MSTRSHFWLRLGGIALILIAEFLPRFASRDASTRRSTEPDRARVAQLANR